MSSLDNLKLRLKFNGETAEGRMQSGKLKTLKKALLYSYQAATAVLSDGRMFRCLINPDKLKNDYDDKIISIPFKDICLGTIDNKERKKTSEDEEEIGLKPRRCFHLERNQYRLANIFTKIRRRCLLQSGDS